MTIENNQAGHEDFSMSLHKSCLGHSSMPAAIATMNLDEAVSRVRQCAKRMNKLYQDVVFDEWAIVSLLPKHGKILFYEGTRKEDFAKNFGQDILDLRAALMSDEYGFGDYEFARNAEGTKIDAFMNIGEGLFLISNNLINDMDAICKDGRWLSAQRPFIELSELFQSNPLFYPA